MPAWRQPSPLPVRTCLRRQRGQALVFGIFLLMAGLAGVYFLFNTGQMTAEKTRLVTTADAVAHGAGLMQARALNFDAYANRALVANEVLVAQMVSLSSWAQYAQTHADNLVWQFPECAEPYGYGAAFGALFRYGLVYAMLCYATVQYAAEYISQIASEVPKVAEKVVAAAEVNKSAIMLAQKALHAPGALQKARADVMQQIADANYRGDGSVTASAQFESVPWPAFTHLYQGGARTRFAEVTRAAANTDAFVRQRNWTAVAVLPPFWEWTCAVAGRRNSVKRRGGTELVNYDEWKAEDTESYWEVHNVGRLFPRCGRSEQPVAYGEQQAHPESADQDESPAVLGGSPTANPDAHGYASSRQWTTYSGLPSYYDLDPERMKPDAPEPRLGLKVSVTRAREQIATPEGRSAIRQAADPTGTRRNVSAYQSGLDDGKMTATAAVEVWFARPPDSAGNAWGKTLGTPRELPSLFNPYWQVRLIDPAQLAVVSK
nr:pilus assembly protein TadG-related protein [uncultured Noviherbaspirillum sp.]